MAKEQKRGAGPTNSANDELPKAKLNVANLKRSMRLFAYLGKQKWKFVLGMIFLAASAGVGLIFPLKSGQMLGYLAENTLSPEEISGDLMKIGLVLLIILVLQAAFSFGRVYLFAQVTENILKALRKDTFKQLIQMPMSFFSKNQVAELSSRMATDISVISDAFTVNIAELIRQTIVGVGGLILLIVTSEWAITKWFLVIIPPLTIVAIMFSRRIRKFSKVYQEKIAESNVVVGEALTGITNVKTFTNEKYEINKYDKISEVIREFGIKYGIFRGLFFSFVMIFVFGSIFFILWQMLFALKVDKSITAEDFGTFMMLSLFVAGSLGGLPEQIASIQRALGATDRVFELIDGDIESIDLLKDNSILEKHTKGEIQFKNISFNYPSRPDFNVLKNIDFKVEAGQTVALVGSSGSGKSTIASLILRFYDPTSGSVLIDGIDNRSISLTELRKQIALVPQDVILFAGSIRDNIAYGRPNATDLEIEEAARKANAYDFVFSFPDKFQTLVGERGIQLSGGQRQRIAIARAVLKNPSILILDEATSSLDSESEYLVQEALDKLMVGRTSVVIAHRLATIKNADKIIVLQDGVVQESGKHQELILNDQGLYYKLSKMQFELS
ncbi:ABC transporter ATP-binding protein [Aurantibacillus circumpalustris]|uniref:ABC transporter ATP-binding protein n=1 Tax=Aurantibacillus circumpalustris TaxID=3036359 RepID=UPI00295AB5D7|nr:ABC transporter transmembrane domain-containing protein [Aurantibacillus circumpalustris]